MSIKNILVAEDNPDDAFIFRMMFRKAALSHRLHMVEDGEDVIQWLEGRNGYSDRERFPLPDLLILDLKMPIKTGFDVLEWMRSNGGYQRIPTVILSSSDDPKDIKRAAELRTTHYFLKSPNLDDVMEYLRTS